MVSSSYRIRGIRKMRKMSGTEVAAKLGISPQFYYDIERGKKGLSADNALKLSNIFRVPMEYLLGQAPNPNINHLSADDYADGNTDESYFQDLDETIKRHSTPAPEWANSKDKRDFKKMLEEDEPVMFDGVPLSEDDKEKIKRVMEAMFWDAKKKNKRKPIEE